MWTVFVPSGVLSVIQLQKLHWLLEHYTTHLLKGTVDTTNECASPAASLLRQPFTY